MFMKVFPAPIRPRRLSRKFSTRNIQTLTDTKQRLNVLELNNAVKAIEEANVLIFSCMGSSGVAAEEGVMRFTPSR